MSDLVSYIRNVPDFPKKGIVFRDITTLLKEPEAFKKAVATFYEKYDGAKIDKIIGVESRGFILGAALALRLGVGFVPIRKKGKLPAETVREEYSLEYGKDSIEIHRDALKQGERVLIHDDLLATGGTMAAACKLVKQVGGTVVGLCFLVELNFLKGRDRLEGYDVFSLIQYDKE
ncbi:MAG: adenine phosphoribosyltransferase [Ignavibacteriales bacterium]|nr:adenine phosphoribosyltransferase [Ignavibacteriales bacterium]